MERKSFFKKLLAGIAVIIATPKVIAETTKPKFVFQSFYDENKYEFMECDNLNIYLGISKGDIRYHIYTKEEWTKFKKGFRKKRTNYECRHLEYSSSGLTISWNCDKVDKDGNYEGKSIFIDSDIPLKVYSSMKDYKNEMYNNSDYKIYKIK